MRWSPPFALLTLCVLLLSLSALPTIGQGTLTDGVVTPWSIEAVGPVSLKAETGGLRTFSLEGITSARLVAEAVEFDVQWERGTDLRAGELNLVNLVTEQDRERIHAQDVEIQFEQWRGNPVFAVYDNETEMTMTTDSLTGFTFLPELEPRLVRAGIGPNATGTPDGPDAGFWWDLEGPVTSARGEGMWQVEGSFSIFTHDIMIHVEEPDDQWSRWTGYWQSDPDAPVTEFEVRFTNIHVTNGTLIFPQREPLTLFSPLLEGIVDGILSSPGVTGQLQQQGKRFIFDEDPMELTGTGDLRLAGETGRSESFAQLRLQAQGDFQVDGAGTVETTGPEALESMTRFYFILALSGLIVASITTAGIARLGYLPPVSAGLRERRHDHWMERGKQKADDGKWEQAARCFRKATQMKHDAPNAWYDWAHSEMEAGNLERTEEIAVRAQEIPGIDLLDLLDLRAYTAWKRGDQQAFEEHLRQLAQEHPPLARGLIRDLELDVSTLSPAVREVLGSEKEDVIDGYA